MAKKKYYLVLDTETASNASLVYDIGYTLVDRKGNVVKQANFIVKDFFDHPFLTGLLERDLYSRKKYRTFYKQHIDTHQEMVQSFKTIRAHIRRVIDKYNAIVVAYNASFDVDALTKMSNDYGMKTFFKGNTEIWDLWNVALSVLVNSRNYQKFCLENNFVSEKGNLRTSAEVVYRYISKDVEFEEAHTALADTEIEAAILNACLKRHKKFNTEYVTHIFKHPVWVARCRG